MGERLIAMTSAREEKLLGATSVPGGTKVPGASDSDHVGLCSQMEMCS